MSEKDRDEIAVQAKVTLSGKSGELRSARTTEQVIDSLQGLHYTYRGSFKPHEIWVLVRSWWYLRRLGGI